MNGEKVLHDGAGSEINSLR